MRRFLALSSAIALTVMMSSFTYAQEEEMDVDPFPEIEIVFLNEPGSFVLGTSPSTGFNLNGVGIQDPAFTIPVVEDLRTGDDQLTISVIGLVGDGPSILAGGTAGTLGFGINSTGSDAAFDFDAFPFNESVTFAFNQDLFITEVDLNSSLIGGGSNPESFEIGGIVIDGNNPGDVFSFINADSPEGLFVAADDGVLFQALVGTGNLESLTVQIAPPPEVPEPSPSPAVPVPEPSTAVLLVSLGMIGVARRRRK